ncbi:MAG: zf-HC2 domain-containing protein [Armatimonadota bacterium]
MRCERAKELFSDYTEGNIDYALTDTVRCHIDKCPSCKYEYSRFRSAYTALNMLPDIEPPIDFRHDVILKLARMQQEKQSIKQGIFDLSWSQLFGRSISARGIAVACTAIILAVIMLNMPDNAYRYAAGIFNPEVSIVSIPQRNESPNNSQSAITSLTSEMKDRWVARKLIRNSVWTTVKSTQNGPDITLYTVDLSLNRSAFVNDESVNSINVKVFSIPSGQFDLDAVKNTDPFWKGAISDDSPISVPVTVYQSSGDAGSVNLLIAWKVLNHEFGQVVFLPSRIAASNDVLGLNQDMASKPNLYTALQSVSRDFCVPVIANANLHVNPAVMTMGAGNLNSELKGLLKPIDLDWLCADGAVYIDRQYKIDTE